MKHYRSVIKKPIMLMEPLNAFNLITFSLTECEGLSFLHRNFESTSLIQLMIGQSNGHQHLMLVVKHNLTF